MAIEAYGDARYRQQKAASAKSKTSTSAQKKQATQAAALVRGLQLRDAANQFERDTGLSADFARTWRFTNEQLARKGQGGGYAPGPSVSSYSGGRAGGGGGYGRRGGGGGGGGAGNAAAQAAYAALIQNLQASLADRLRPYDDMKAELARLAAQGREGIGRGTEELLARITMGRGEAQSAAATRDQMLAQLAQQMAQREAQRRAALEADLRAQGVSPEAMGALLSGVGGVGDLANRQQAMSAALNAALAQQYADREQSAQAAERGALASLNTNEAAAALAILRQRQEAEQAIRDQIDQIRLQAAQAGIKV